MDSLNSVWSFFNPIWILVIIAVVAGIYFIVAYIKANKAVDKNRAEIQQNNVNDAYGDYIHQKYDN